MNIALISEAGGGKDTVSDILTQKYGYTRYAFADLIRYLAELLFPERYNESNKDRKLLQKLDILRSIDPLVYVNNVLRQIDNRNEESERYSFVRDSVIITDTRQPNEYQALKDRGFTFVRIVVDENVRKQRMVDRGDVFVEDDMKHHTESFYDTFECDYTINNNGTLEELDEEIEQLINVMTIVRKQGFK